MSQPDPSWDRLKELFAAASPLPTSEREAFLRARGAGDGTVREVLELLGQGPSLDERPGDTIGPYKLLECLGEGGFGTVWMAEQRTPIQRLVALKLLKAGMDSAQVLARFEQERQALALMQHPNIAQVYDAGTTPRGRPFFAMELVKGVPITDYATRERLTVEQRLEVFVQVCRAVQHAHQKGVIHRDIKPSNVLVTVVDGKPAPKAIDFGIAKATQGRLTSRTLFTEHKQLLGTPLYMSPEQTQLSGVDVDTRSDVYSLGVLLYELLTGTTPFSREQLLHASQEEMHRLLREVDPQKPSTRIATLGQTATTTAAERSVELRQLGSLLRGDLDWIVMKCLEKERARRFATVQELVQDLERHLTGKPVLAAPPSAAYRLRKFLLRHRTGAWLTASLLGIAVAGATVYGKVTATERQTSAERAFHAARQAADRGNPQKALDRLETAASMGFDPIEVGLARLEMYEARGDFAKATEELTALRSRPDLASQRDLVELLWHDPTRIGNEAVPSGAWRDVLPRLLESPDLPPTWRSYGRALMANAFDEVFVHLETALEEEPRNRAAAEVHLWLSLMLRGPTASLPAARQFRARWPSDAVGSTFVALCHKIRRDDEAAAVAMGLVDDPQLLGFLKETSDWAIEVRDVHVTYAKALFGQEKPNLLGGATLLAKVSQLDRPVPDRLRVHPLMKAPLVPWLSTTLATVAKGTNTADPPNIGMPCMMAVRALLGCVRGDYEPSLSQFEVLIANGAEDLLVFREDIRRMYLVSLHCWAAKLAKARPGTFLDAEVERFRQELRHHAAQLTPFLATMPPKELQALSEITSTVGDRWTTREIVSRAMQSSSIDDKTRLALAGSLVRCMDLAVAEEILTDVRTRVPDDPQILVIDGWIKKRRADSAAKPSVEPHQEAKANGAAGSDPK